MKLNRNKKIKFSNKKCCKKTYNDFSCCIYCVDGYCFLLYSNCPSKGNIHGCVL